MRKLRRSSFLIAGFLSVCAAPANGDAPLIESATWLNTAGGQAPALEGRTVLVEFWTYGCINCVRTIPAVRDLYTQYSGRGLEVVGVHSPEFSQERDLANVREAVVRLDIPYPVAIDNDYRVWTSFANRYWPALYLLDREGRIVWTHVGELHRNTPAWTDLTSLLDAVLDPAARSSVH